MAKKITIELTEAQARVVLSAVEEWFRLRMGQYWELADSLAFLGFKHDPKNKSAFHDRILRRDAIKEVLNAVMRIAFPLYGTPDEINPETHIASDIWSQVRWEMTPRNEYATTPMQLGPEPMPKITVEDVDDA